MDRLMKLLLDQNYSEDEASIIIYGWRKLVLFLINIIISLVIGIVFGCGIEVAIFVVLFLPIRLFAGGYHMNKLWKCEILSTLIIVAVSIFFLVYSKFDNIEWVLHILTLISVLIHYLCAPQDTPNKRLFVAEKKRFKMISSILVSVYVIAYIILSVNDGLIYKLRGTITMALCVSALSLIENFFAERRSLHEDK